MNKLGDLDRKIASKATYLLSQILIPHPNMKIVFVNEVERLLLRPNIADRASYYAITFLNQIVLTKNDEKVANKLISLYFCLFQAMVRKITAESNVDPDVKLKPTKKPRYKARKVKINKTLDMKPLQIGAVHSKMMSAILVGVNRAYPFSNLEPEVFNENLSTLFQISHIANFNTSIQALHLIFQVQKERSGRKSSEKSAISDRYYRALYGLILDQRLYDCSKQAMFLNLLYKSLKADISLERVQSFLKRILQSLSNAKVPLICASLFMIGQLLETRRLWHLIQAPNFKDNEEKSYDALKRDPLYSNAASTCLWELVIFEKHFHPTVSLYAQTLNLGKIIEAPPGATHYDPLANHTLTRFLDRFVYKAPKSVKSMYVGNSIMQPRFGKSLWSGKKKQVICSGVMMDDLPVNQQTQSSNNNELKMPDEQFYKTYFEMKGDNGKNKKNFKNEYEADYSNNLLDEDEFDEDEVFNAMSRDLKPNELGDDVDDDDDVILDLEDGDEFSDEDIDEDEELDESQIAEMDFEGHKMLDINDQMEEWADKNEDKVSFLFYTRLKRN